MLNLRDGFSDMRDLLGYEGSLMRCCSSRQAYTDCLQRAVDYNLRWRPSLGSDTVWTSSPPPTTSPMPPAC